MRKDHKAHARVLALLVLCALGLAGCGQEKEDKPVTVPALEINGKGVVTAYLTSGFNEEYYDLAGLEEMARMEAEEYSEAHKSGDGADPVTVVSVEAVGPGTGAEGEGSFSGGDTGEPAAGRADTDTADADRDNAGSEDAALDEKSKAQEERAGKETPDTAGESSGESVRAVVVYRYVDGAAYADYNDTVFFYGTVAQAMEEGYGPEEALESVKDGGKLDKEALEGMGKSHILIAETPAMVKCPGKVTHISSGLTIDRETGAVNALNAEGLYYIIAK